MDHENNWKYCKLVEQNETGEIILHRKNLDLLFDNWSKIRNGDDPITIVSFIGPQSCGKSFFSNLYIEYTRMLGSLSWTKRIKREGLQGFSYGVKPNIITAGQLVPEKDINAIYFYPELLKLNVDQREEFICILHVHHGDRKMRNREVDIALDVVLAMMSTLLVNIMWNDKNTLSDINKLVTNPRYLPIKEHLTGNVVHLIRGQGVREKNDIQLEESSSLHDNAGLVKLSFQQYSAVNNLMKAISTFQNVNQVQATLSNIFERFKEAIKIINVCNGFDTPLPLSVLETSNMTACKSEPKSAEEYVPENEKLSKRRNELRREDVRMPKEIEEKIKSFFSSQFSEQVNSEIDHWINNDLLNQNFVPIQNELGSSLQYFNEQNITRLLFEAKEKFQENQKLINEEILECMQNFYVIMNTQFEDVPHFGGNALRKALKVTLTSVTSDLKFPQSKERIMKASRNMFKFYYEQTGSYEVPKSIETQYDEFNDVEKNVVPENEILDDTIGKIRRRQIVFGKSSNSRQNIEEIGSNHFGFNNRQPNTTRKLTSIPTDSRKIGINEDLEPLCTTNYRDNAIKHHIKDLERILISNHFNTFAQNQTDKTEEADKSAAHFKQKRKRKNLKQNKLDEFNLSPEFKDEMTSREERISPKNPIYSTAKEHGNTKLTLNNASNAQIDQKNGASLVEKLSALKVTKVSKLSKDKSLKDKLIEESIQKQLRESYITSKKVNEELVEKSRKLGQGTETESSNNGSRYSQQKPLRKLANDSDNQKIDNQLPREPSLKRNLPPLLFQITLSKIGMATVPQKRRENNSASTNITSYPGEVGILMDGKWVCGDDVKEFSCKGMMKKFWSFEAIFNTHDFKDTVVIHGDNIHVTAPFLLGVFLKILKRKAENERSGKISAALISVPFWFSTYKRIQIVEAGTIAGFDSVELVNENTASAYYAYTNALSPPTEKMVVISENSNRVDISIYSYDQHSKIISMQGQSGDYETNHKDFFKKFVSGIFVYLFNEQEQAGIEEKTLKSLDKLWELTKSRVNIPIELNDKTVLIRCESDHWREFLWKFASKITSSEKISVRNDSPFLGLASFLHACLARKNGSVYSLFKDSIPFDVICSQGKETCLVLRKNSAFSSRGNQTFGVGLPKFFGIFSIEENDLLPQRLGKFNLKSNPPNTFNIYANLESTRNGIIEMTAVEYTEGAGGRYAPKRPLPECYFEWIPCKTSDETLGVYKSLVDQIKLQTNVSSLVEQTKSQTEEMANKIKQVINAGAGNFKSSLGKNMVIKQIDDLLEAIKDEGIQKKTLNKHVSYLESIAQKYELQL